MLVKAGRENVRQNPAKIAEVCAFNPETGGYFRSGSVIEKVGVILVLNKTRNLCPGNLKVETEEKQPQWPTT